jgi:hypothetical protein
VTSHLVSDNFGRLGSCQPRACRRGARGRRRGGDLAHPAGKPPQLGAAGRDSKQIKKRPRNSDQHFPVNPCRTMCSRWPTSELPPTCVTAAWCGPITMVLAREVGAPNNTTWRPTMHLLVAGSQARHLPQPPHWSEQRKASFDSPSGCPQWEVP